MRPPRESLDHHFTEMRPDAGARPRHRLDVGQHLTTNGLTLVRADRQYRISGIGLLLWMWADGHTSIATMIQRIVERYGVDHEMVRAEVVAFIDELAAIDFIALEGGEADADHA